MKHRRLDINDCISLALLRGGKCLSTIFITSKSKYLWECGTCMHQWWATFQNVNHKTWCPKCANKLIHEKQKRSLSDCQAIAARKEGQCLGDTYIGDKYPLQWQCKNGHIWSARPASVFKMNSWCPVCAGRHKVTIDDCHKIASERSGALLSVVYRNSHSNLEWQCEKGHTWFASFSRVSTRGHWCPHCKNKAENKIRKLFELQFNKKFPSVFHKDIRNPKTGAPLQLDGYCEELKLAFEYQGAQHYKEVNFYGSKQIEPLEDIQARDAFKAQRCTELGIKLIVIPYNADAIEIIKGYLDEA